jgi:hypothetical protein
MPARLAASFTADQTIFSSIGTSSRWVIRELALGKCECPHVAGEQLDAGVCRQVGRFASERFRASREHHGGDPEVQSVVRGEQTLDEPTAEEPGSACNKDSVPAHFFPEPQRVVENMIEIQRSNWFHAFLVVNN